MKVITPPIKSQGIKTKLVPWIKAIAPSDFNRWIEPFLGTGVVAFNLAKEDAILSDTNPHIVNLYQRIQREEITPESVREYLDHEGELLRTAGDNGYDHYRLVRERFNTQFSSEDFIFLSRAGFNGMMRFSKKGKWNIPFCKKPDRFAQSYVTKITNQVTKVHRAMAPGWVFSCNDFAETISRAQDGDVIYCDPPYFGRYVDYYNGWTEEDEERLFQALSATPARFIMSTWHHNAHRSNEMMERYWNRFNVVTKDHFYHSGGKIENRQSVVEALVCNFPIPELDLVGLEKKPERQKRKYTRRSNPDQVPIFA